MDMDKALGAALDYIPHWLDFQVAQFHQPGCAIAVRHKGKLVLDRAFGFANLKTGTRLTPAHSFRVASHSKSFVAAGILKLVEARKLRLDDAIGAHVPGLHPTIAGATIAQALSHGAGIIRDGLDAGMWQQRRRALSRAQLLEELKGPATIAANLRMKYSNHGFGLLGLVIEAAAGEPYRRWIEREIVSACGLQNTQADGPLKRGLPICTGYSAQWPAGERLAYDPNVTLDAIAPAGGFIANAADLSAFFAQLDPAAKTSCLSPASRREMTRPHREVPDSAIPRQYGIGLILGETGGWRFFGHSGGFPGFITRTCVYPAQGLTISVLTNCIDGFAHIWLDGAMHIIQTFARYGAPARRLASWSGRWATHWGAGDYVPMGDKVLVANPAFAGAPFMDASVITVTAKDKGVISRANGFGSHGEAVRRVRDARGKVSEVWFAGSRMKPVSAVAREMRKKLGPSK